MPGGYTRPIPQNTFRIKKLINLIFDGNQQEMTDIKYEIFQRSSISLILFLIYIKKLFIIIKAKHNI